MTLFALTDTQQQIRAEADRFCRDKLAPFAAAMDDDESWPEEIFPMLGKQGYLGATVPVDFGGQGLSLLEAGLIC